MGLEHGYWVGYYNDGEGKGMDATVYEPIIDLQSDAHFMGEALRQAARAFEF